MSKYSADEKIQICEEYLSGKSGASELCIEHGLSKGKPPGAFWNWISRYQKYGRDAFCGARRPLVRSSAATLRRSGHPQLGGHFRFNHHGVVLGCTL